MTVKELAAEWRQHPATVYRKIASGTIPSVRLGNGTSALRIPRAELEARLHEIPAERRETHQARGSRLSPAHAGLCQEGDAHDRP
jgi:excisionase family DNA binding protein